MKLAVFNLPFPSDICSPTTNPMKAMYRNLLLISSLVCSLNLVSCQKQEPSANTLPIYGVRSLDQQGDTIYHTIDEFTFINQDSQKVTRADFAGKVYVADFFFTSCPTICPSMTQQMLRVYNNFKDSSQVLLLSHSIDFRNDSVAVLKDYADKLEVSSEKWHFVTGERDELYRVAKDKYYISAMEDEAAPGGYLHNGKFVLVDPSGRIRGYYTGTDAKDIGRLIEDMQTLLAEQ